MLLPADDAAAQSGDTARAGVDPEASPPYGVAGGHRPGDADAVHRWLSEQSYWRHGITRGELDSAMASSVCLYARRADSGDLVGFIRVVTDTVTHAWVTDLFVSRDHRGRGVGGQLLMAALEHPAVRNTVEQLAATTDAHALLARHGFRGLPDPRSLVVRRAAPRRAHR